MVATRAHDWGTGVTPERWQRVKDVFSAASALTDAERRRYLEEACRGDPELLAEIDSLLAAHAVEQAIVDRPAPAQFAGDFMLQAAADRWLGERIGAYEIVALIGHGGMGQVYRARRIDAEYEKEVAIKLVPGGYQRDFVLQRLRAERQILANLEHPNIARLIDGGATDEGSPYLVMELVAGEPIDRYAEQRNLPIRARLGLFRDVCEAVSYAHQRLVVHRDLKPNNILVTADGTVKLLDFGIAKLLRPGNGEAGAARTVTLMQALTPSFSSPEQILGKPITTASDVYSLGVVLYVLLTGQSPYRSALNSAQDAIREVCETEPVRPSAALAASGKREFLDRDLDAIMLRALRKEPEERYASVEQFSADLWRYLEGLPVTARGDELGYRTRKYLRRHKLELAGAAVILLTLIGGIIASQREAHIAAREKQRAERHFASVRKLADVFMFQVHDAIKDLPGSTEARGLLVNTALEYLNTLAAEAGDDRDLQVELAAAYEKVADIQGRAYGASNKGEPRAALESYTKAIALLEPIVAADTGESTARHSLARNYVQQSRLLLLLGDSAKAASASQRAVSAFETLAAVHADRATQLGLADAYSAHAYTIDFVGGQDDASIAYAKKAASILEELTRQHPDDHDLAYKLATAYSTLAITVLGKDARPETLEESLAFHYKALAVDEKLVAATHGENTKYVRALLLDRMNVAFVLNEKQDYHGAVDNARAAQPLLTSLRSDSKNAQAQIDGANLAWPLGHSLLQLGEVDEAAALFEENAATLEKIAREGDTLKVQYLLGTMACGLGEVHSRRAQNARHDEARLREWRLARSYYEKAIPHFERLTSKLTLDYMDQHPVDDASAGLARASAEITKLESTSPSI
jgi:non-specific serine/threonine protein kinase/serine/threonine-protein kinase